MEVIGFFNPFVPEMFEKPPESGFPGFSMPEVKVSPLPETPNFFRNPGKFESSVPKLSSFESYPVVRPKKTIEERWPKELKMSPSHAEVFLYARSGQNFAGRVQKIVLHDQNHNCPFRKLPEIPFSDSFSYHRCCDACPGHDRVLILRRGELEEHHWVKAHERKGTYNGVRGHYREK